MNLKLMVGVVLLFFYYYYSWPLYREVEDWTKSWNAVSISRVVVSVVYFWAGVIIICNEVFTK